MSKAGETATFTYNADGLRVKKVCTTTGTTNYTLHGKNVVHLSNGSNNLHFFYDAQNRPAVVAFNGTPYGYVHNLQGDITAIVNSAGTKVVEYVYDAWGKPLFKSGPLASTLGTLNPFRYRGYVFDEETGLYYLQSRYYNPKRVRFLNADVYVSTGYCLLSSNMFIYCRSNPVTRNDTSGTFENTIFDDIVPWDDSEQTIGGRVGTNTWNAVMRTLQSAADGLSMAAGQYKPFYSQKHHILSNKNKTYTPQYVKITDRYDISLNSSSNIVDLPDHKGRHTKTYHQMMLFAVSVLDSEADGNAGIFNDGLSDLREFLLNNHRLPYMK